MNAEQKGRAARDVFFISAAVFIFYAVIGLLFVFALENGSSVWSLIPSVSGIIIGVTAAFCVLIGVIGGITLNNVYTAPAINAAGFGILALLLFFRQLFTDAAVLGLAGAIAGAVFLLTAAADYTVLLVKVLRAKKPGLRGYIAESAERSGTYKLAAAAAVVYGISAVPFYVFASDFTVTTIIVAFVLPLFSLAAGIWSGLRLDRRGAGALVNAAALLVFLLPDAAVDPMKIFLVPLMTAITFVFDIIAWFAAGVARSKKASHSHSTNTRSRGR